MKTISTIILALVAITYSAQNPPHGGKQQAGAGNIFGKILDANTNQPVEFATVALFNETDSSLVTGGITSVEGEYFMDKIPNGSFYLKASFIGYEAFYQSGIKMEPSNPYYKIEAISLKEASDVLDAVEIVSEQYLMETRIDKKIYNTDKDLSSKGGTGIDVLRNIPSVDIDSEDNILLRGDENVNILIDGRPSSMPASVLLKQIAASQIAKVEIVTNPSAKYDPEGMSGIINIVMKKNKVSGFNANLNQSFTYGKAFKSNTSLSLNYKTDKINLYTNLNYYDGKHWHGGYQDRTSAINDTLYRLDSDNEGLSGAKSLSAKLGLDYFINEKNTVYVSSSGNFGGGDSENLSNFRNYTGEDALIDSSNRTTNGTSSDNRYGVNVGWQRTFKKSGHTFDFDADYNVNESEGTNENEEEFSSLMDFPTLQNVTNTNNREVLYIRADYVLPITDSMTFEAGFHSTTKNKQSTIFSETYNYGLSSPAFEDDTSINNSFIFNQQVYAGYVTFGHQIGKLGYKVGLRAEQTNTYAELVNSNEVFKNPYFSLFPSGHLSYALNKKHEMQLSYSKRINRPHMHALNPFPDYSNPYSLYYGNPFLRPEFIDVYELGHVFRGKKLTLNTSVYHRQINNMMQRFLTINGNVSEVTFVNFDKAELSGLELIASYKPTKKLRATLSFNSWFSRINDAIVGERVPSNGWDGKLSLSYTFKGGWASQADYRYNGPMQVTQGTIQPRHGVNLSLRKSILNHRGSLSVRVNDIFFTQYFAFKTDDANDLSFDMRHRWESRQFSVNFNYFFGKMIKGKEKRRLKDTNGGDGKTVPGM